MVVSLEALICSSRNMEIKYLGKVAIVSVEDNLDQFNCSELRSLVISIIAQGKMDIVIDLAGAKYVDSSGIDVLIFFSNLFKRYARTLKLTGLQPNPMIVIKKARLDEVWEIYQSLDKAVASLGG